MKGVLMTKMVQELNLTNLTGLYKSGDPGGR